MRQWDAFAPQSKLGLADRCMELYTVNAADRPSDMTALGFHFVPTGGKRMSVSITGTPGIDAKFWQRFENNFGGNLLGETIPQHEAREILGEALAANPSIPGLPAPAGERASDILSMLD